MESFNLLIMKISTAQAAEILKVTQRRVIALIEQGKLPAEKFANVYMIDEKDLELVKERKAGRPPKAKDKK
jgi:excisionase family DNA binding protein